MTYHWQKRRSKVGHIDDWLMTYADMITLLLCFFVIFTAVSVVGKKHPPTPPQPVVEIAQPAPEPTPPPAPAQVKEATATSDLILPFPVQEQEADQETTQPAAPLVSTEPTPPVATAQAEPVPSSAQPTIFETAKKEAPATFEQKGDRLTSIEMNSAAFFDSGSATISESGRKILADVAVSLKDEKFKDYQITVEGHTDDSPISTPLFPSNWELSTARASAVVHFFLEQQIPPQKLRAAGYADTFPKFPNRDALGKPIPDNQSRNRRVIIKVEKVEKAQ